MNIKKVDDKPLVIHTKQKTKFIHMSRVCLKLSAEKQSDEGNNRRMIEKSVFLGYTIIGFL